MVNYIGVYSVIVLVLQCVISHHNVTEAGVARMKATTSRDDKR